MKSPRMQSSLLLQALHAVALTNAALKLFSRAAQSTPDPLEAACELDDTTVDPPAPPEPVAPTGPPLGAALETTPSPPQPDMHEPPALPVDETLDATLVPEEPEVVPLQATATFPITRNA
jgi:hypothetical protein